MKKSLLILSAAFSLLAGTISAQTYSNTSWDGAWIASGALTCYVIFDGNGNITETGLPGTTGGQGSYAVTSQGSITGTISFMGNNASLSGSFTNDSTVSGAIMGAFNVTFYKVKNLAVLKGTYDGTATQSNTTLPVNFTVDVSGNVTSSTDLPGPISGHVYYSNGKLTGLIKSGATSPFNEIEINSTNYNGTTLTGTATLTGNVSGTFSLTKSATTSVNTIASAQFNVYPNPVKDQFVIDGNVINGAIKVYDILGNELMNTSITSNKTIINVNSMNLSNGVYFYSITSSGTAVKVGKFIVE